MLLVNCVFYRTDFAGTQFHTHSYYQLHYIIDGKGHYELSKKKKIKVSPGSFFIIFPEEAHRIVLHNRNKPLVEYLIGCRFNGDCSFIQGFFDNELRRERVLRGIKISRQFFEGIRHQLQSQDTHICQSAFLRLFSRISGMYSSSREMEYSTTIEDALIAMHDKIEEKLDLNELCNQLAISKCHFIRKFKKYTGLPPMRYFMYLKMETAKVILTQSNMSLSEIAQKLEFADAFHFSKHFKKVTGSSPSDFRSSV